MMKYQNTKTGIVIDVNSKIHGGDWVELGKASKQESKVKEVPKSNPKSEAETDTVPKNITKEQIMKELDAFGTKYNPADKKQDLYDLMMKGK